MSAVGQFKESDGLLRRADSWKLWRGSLDLLVHVVRVAVTAVAANTGSEGKAVPVQVLLRVRSDEEAFEGVEEFKERVTQEGLHRFDSIYIGVGHSPTSSLVAEIFMAPGMPAVQVDVVATQRIGAEVVTEVADRVAAAIERGFPRWEARCRSTWGFIGVLVVALFAGGALSELFDYLFEIENDDWAVVVVMLIGGVVVSAFYWVLPEVEIAPPGQRRFDRLRRAVVTIVLGLVGAGIAKQLFG